MEAGEIPLTLEDVDISSIIEEYVHSVSGAVSEAGIKFEVTAARSHLVADQHMLTRVITNLLGNAVKYSPKNETISK